MNEYVRSVSINVQLQLKDNPTLKLFIQFKCSLIVYLIFVFELKTVGFGGGL